MKNQRGNRAITYNKPSISKILIGTSVSINLYGYWEPTTKLLMPINLVPKSLESLRPIGLAKHKRRMVVG